MRDRGALPVPKLLVGSEWRETNFAEALALLAAELGHGYVSERELRADVAQDSKRLLVGAAINGRIVGLVRGGPASEDDLRAVRALGVGPISPTAVASTLVVAAPHRHRGMGSALLGRLLEDLRAQGCASCLMVKWLSGSPDSSRGVAQRAGFRAVGRVPDYWAEDSVLRGYKCPVCGRPCRCTAEVMVLSSLD